jgi:hypothetical protein
MRRAVVAADVGLDLDDAGAPLFLAGSLADELGAEQGAGGSFGWGRECRPVQDAQRTARMSAGRSPPTIELKAGMSVSRKIAAVFDPVIAL